MSLPSQEEQRFGAGRILAGGATAASSTEAFCCYSGGNVALTIGQTVGEYQVIDVIGSGGMGTVYKVRHLISDRIEAIKVVLPHLVGTAELAERFIREIRVQASLSHPNIASLHNALRFENQLMMVMEYVDGITLQSQLRQGALEWTSCVDVILQVLGALAYAHGQGVIHRDIKPANVMLTSAGVVKLMDFGIARSLAESNRQLTLTGAAVGSVYYMSPEQIHGSSVDGRSDLYSTGIVLYEMVTGAKPITGESSWAIMNAHLAQLPAPPVVLNPALPAALSSLIMKSLEKNPANRYRSATEFAESLRSVRYRLSPSMPPQFPTMVAGVEATLHRPYSTPQPKQSVSPHVGVATPVPGPVDTPPGGSTTGGTKRFDPEQLEQLRRRLAIHVGPMARIIVDRAAKKAATLEQLYEMLAPEFPSEERKKFLQSRPR